jgi:hypothetical protein
MGQEITERVFFFFKRFCKHLQKYHSTAKWNGGNELLPFHLAGFQKKNKLSFEIGVTTTQFQKS